MNKKRIAAMLYAVDKEIFSHVIIMCDTFDYEYYEICVERGEDINKYINNDGKNMQSIKEIYNLDMDIESQLNETRSWHIETHNQPKVEILPKEEIIDVEENNTINSKNDLIFESNLIMKAYKYAKEKHNGQYRKGNRHLEYITHPVYVAKLVSDYKDNSHNIEVLEAAALLHDVCEDCHVSYEELIQEFGIEVASLVKELTTNKDIKDIIGKKKYLSISMKNMTSWALCIKLCDRLSNITDLLDTDIDFCEKYINETIEILNYIADNRKLTKTHLKIISTIITVLDIIIDKLFVYGSKGIYNINSLKLKYSNIIQL